jgi:dUTPase
MVIQKVERAILEIVTELNTSVRAKNGFGSTGTK